MSGAKPLPVPYDRPRARPLTDVYQVRPGATHRWSAPPALNEALRVVARAELASPYMLLAASQVALLQRWTGSTYTPINSVYANRGRKGTEKLIGYFATSLLLRFNAAGEPTFRELLARVRDTVIDAHSHGDLNLSFGMLGLRAPLDLFQVSLNYRDFSTGLGLE